MWIVCAFYTKNTVYEEHSKNLIQSLKTFNLSYDVTPIDNRGDWYSNMQYKPTFLKQMMEKHYPNSVVYVDADAVICQPPDYFNKLDSTPEVNIAVHVLDHSKYRRNHHPLEMLSGTIFLRNTPEVGIIIEEWIAICSENSTLWDQVALSRVLKSHRYHLLPEEYCVIFDYMQNVKKPVIKHFQASRKERRKLANRVSLQQSGNSIPRIVQKGEVRIKRMRGLI